MLIPTQPRTGCAGTPQSGRVKKIKVLRPQTSKLDRVFNSVTQTGCGWPSFWVIRQFSSVAESCLTLFDPMASRPGPRALARSSLLRDWFPCAGAVLSLAQTHRGRPQTMITSLVERHLQSGRNERLHQAPRHLALALVWC